MVGGMALRQAALLGVAVLTLGVGLGSSGRLSYHEAIVAQAAREMLASGDWLVPTLGGTPWLEKPPLAIWLVAGLGAVTGRLDETGARLPSALAALLLALAVERLARRRLGPTVGLLAGLVQLTTAWTVVRGRLADVDMLLAALVAAAMMAFDAARSGGRRGPFFVLLGGTCLAKGVGFGAALVLAAMTIVLLWDRDKAALRRLAWPIGWAGAVLIGLTWPLLVLARYPEAWSLWVLHSAGRLVNPHAPFAGDPWFAYLLAPLGQTLPWTPLALAGAWRSWRRASEDRSRFDRLLVAWALAPVVLVSLARSRNAHYLIHALPPWSIWTALSLARFGERLRRRGWTAARIRLAAALPFALGSLAVALGYGLVAASLDRRGVEWGWYQQAGRAVPDSVPLVLLYDDWDRDPYPTPFGPVPHDLAVRLFYLGRAAVCRFGVEALAAAPPAPSFAVIGRGRDVPELRRLGQVAERARGPRLRARHSKVDDRTFVLFQVTAYDDFNRSAIRSR